MKIMKTKTEVNTQGLLILPVLPAGLRPGIHVDVVLVSKGDESAPLVLLTETGIEVAIPLCDLSNEDIQVEETEDENGINIPGEVLDSAGIPADSDLEIICGDGAIVILTSDSLNRLPEELTELFQELGIHPDTIREVMKKEGYFI